MSATKRVEAELLVPLEEIDAFLASRGWTWQQLERGTLQVGGCALTVEDIQLHLLTSDPVLWCEAMLVNRPEDGGGLWRLFDYQKASMRFRGDVVHEDGAEVGKTREIVGLYLFNAVNNEGGMLIAAFDDGNLDELFDEIEWQLEHNDWLRHQLKEQRLKPYRKHEWKNGNRGIFRPAGHDGHAFRGVHVAGDGFFDEVAKVVNPITLAEFFRALKPSARARLYSVPDGRRDSPFYRLCERAVPFGAARSTAPVSSAPADAVSAGDSLPRRRFTKFNWPKTLMPAPYWSTQREQEAIERYGGRDSAGFVRNVLGGWGDPEDTVFPWATFSPCVRFVDEYRLVKVLYDHATGSIYVDAWRLSPGYEVRGGSDVVDEDAGGSPPLVQYASDRYSVGNLEIGALMRSLFEPPVAGAHVVCGADIGQNEPTEIGATEMRGQHKRWLLRLQLKHLSYDQQADAIRALEGLLAPDHGWGMDAGGVGKVVEDTLRGGQDGHRFDGRLTGFVFNSKTELLDPQTGEPLIDTATGNPRKVTFKELSTELLERDFQRGQAIVPWDPDYIRDFPSHTARKLPSGERTFSGTNDHVIDEKRVEALRLYELERGIGSYPELAYATPPNSRRDSAAFLNGY